MHLKFKLNASRALATHKKKNMILVISTKLLTHHYHQGTLKITQKQKYKIRTFIFVYLSYITKHKDKKKKYQVTTVHDYASPVWQLLANSYFSLSLYWALLVKAKKGTTTQWSTIFVFGLCCLYVQQFQCIQWSHKFLVCFLLTDSHGSAGSENHLICSYFYVLITLALVCFPMPLIPWSQLKKLHTL